MRRGSRAVLGLLFAVRPWLGGRAHFSSCSACVAPHPHCSLQTAASPLLAPFSRQDIWGGGAREKDSLPQLLGDKHCVAVMLGETVRAALAARAGADSVTLQLSRRSVLTFSVARRSVQFSRKQLQAVAKDAAACKKWNSFVAAALAAWQEQGKEGSQAQRLGLLAPLQVAG